MRRQSRAAAQTPKKQCCCHDAKHGEDDGDPGLAGKESVEVAAGLKHVLESEEKDPDHGDGAQAAR